MHRNFGMTRRPASGQPPASSHSRSAGQLLRYENSSPEDREFAAWLFAITAIGAAPLAFFVGVLLFQ